MNFITAEEKAMLERQLSELRAHDKDLVERIAEARAQGDLRENADYHAAREDKALNDAKLRELEARLATAIVTATSRDADGSERVQRRWLWGGGPFQSTLSPEIHFGFPPGTGAIDLEIRWPDGATERRAGVRPGTVGLELVREAPPLR